MNSAPARRSYNLWGFLRWYAREFEHLHDRRQHCKDAGSRCC
jgi:hypothetical protein